MTLGEGPKGVLNASVRVAAPGHCYFIGCRLNMLHATLATLNPSELL